MVRTAKTDISRSHGNEWLVIATCLLVAIVEGIDIQSVGVAAPGLAKTYDIGSAAMGMVMSASILGLMVGAALGGWASDVVGRKPVLMVSMAMLGIFTLATIVAPSTGYLVAARFLAGVGIGGAFPALIALISETVNERHRGIGMGAMYCGLPIGGALAAITMASRAPTDWAAVFHLGGWAPLVLIPIIALTLPAAVRPGVGADRADRDHQGGGILGKRTASTLLLWVSFFFTLLVVYTLLNWLPSLLTESGIERAQALKLSMSMNLGAALGGLATGLAVDKWRLSRVVGLAYAGMVASLAALVTTSGSALYGATFAVGFFVIGGQLVLYAIAPQLYPASLRGKGVGAAVSIGRAGSITGPALAGAMLGIGISASFIPIVLAAGLVIAMITATVLVRMPILAMPKGGDSILSRPQG